MANYDVLKVDGSKPGSVKLSDSVFATGPNDSVLFEAVDLQCASLRQGTCAAKNRSAVRDGGRKPWRQKDTGRARRDTIRTPQWYGDGIVFGPAPRSYSYKTPKKMRRLTLRSALSLKVQRNNFTTVDTFGLDVPKTKELKNVLATFEQLRRVLVVTGNEDVNVESSAHNIPGVQISAAQGLNVLDIASAGSVITTESATEKAEGVLG